MEPTGLHLPNIIAHTLSGFGGKDDQRECGSVRMRVRVRVRVWVRVRVRGQGVGADARKRAWLSVLK